MNKLFKYSVVTRNKNIFVLDAHHSQSRKNSDKKYLQLFATS